MSPLSRRRFLEDAAKAAAGTAVAANALSAQDAPRPAGAAVSPNDKVRVGLIGYGGQGRGNLAAFLRIPEVECAAIADVDASRTAEGVEAVTRDRGRAPDGYGDFRRILDRKDVDAVIVATPDHWHALATVLACQAGKDVYVEKPLATTIAEGRAMVNAARRYDRVVQVGTQQRSAKHFQDAVAFFRSGALGRLRMLRAWAYLDWKGDIGHPADAEPPAGVDYDLWLGPAPKRPFNPMRFHHNFRWFWDYSGGLMTDWGAHMVDVIMWALGEDPIGAMAIGGKYGFPEDLRETPDTQQSIIEFKSQSLLWEHMIGCGCGPWQREHGAEFHGTNGILVVDRNGWEVVSETDALGRPDRVFRMTPLPHRPPTQDFHFEHVKNFVQCVTSRAVPTADVEIGHRSVVACHLANIAVRLRRRVRWDPATETIAGDAEAQALVGRAYRAPWSLPKV